MDMQRLKELIEQIDDIQKLFHPMGGNYSFAKEIHDNPEYQEWVQEIILLLQEIYDRLHDQFIWSSLNILNQNMNGLNDEDIFNEIRGKLKVIGKHLEKYYPRNICIAEERDIMESNRKSPMVFISHSSKDREAASNIVQLIKNMGLNKDQIFCSSIPGYDIKLNGDIIETLRELFLKNDLYVLFVHSDDYYQSPISLNEMGAAWALKTNYCSILLPNFPFSAMKGVVNANTISIKMDNSRSEVKDKLNQLYDGLSEVFNITRENGILWENLRDEFIDKINALQSIVNLNS
ncbi:toll/interleukin-1 receptor domain-containing protein [Anaerocolumna sp. AGMB13020]|uniref:toll/interleukin-1 receptor domain-containing protein n=1 Tax=Anaerocolumna sp. AGMB13020 TaxID=3081750 RepID=UPI0029532180|nr:toll/interleukin-1 receptor domain-containing protein [Anaerocolumna sp. AGMB13020]WOO35114.1 toll/interleukin-1 receptor domain-containing protein [Anaerocolumna sp. AGMB13020]